MRVGADLDVVIPVHGRPDLLAKCLASVEATREDINLQLIVVDDASPDPEAMAPVYDGLANGEQVVRQKENVGFPKTANKGVGVGTAPLVLLLNSDIELKPGALQAMMAAFEDPQVGVVGPMLLFPDDSTDPSRPAGKVQHAGMAVNWRAQLIHANIGWSADHPKVNERRLVQCVTGACLMTRREVWRKVTQVYRQLGEATSGAFNEVYSPGTFEDVEFCLAVRGNNYSVIYEPSAVATHWVGGSSAMVGRGYPLQRNEMIFRARCGHMLAWDEWRFC